MRKIILILLIILVCVKAQTQSDFYDIVKAELDRYYTYSRTNLKEAEKSRNKLVAYGTIIALYGLEHSQSETAHLTTLESLLETWTRETLNTPSITYNATVDNTFTTILLDSLSFDGGSTYSSYILDSTTVTAIATALLSGASIDTAAAKNLAIDTTSVHQYDSINATELNIGTGTSEFEVTTIQDSYDWLILKETSAARDSIKIRHAAGSIRIVSGGSTTKYSGLDITATGNVTLVGGADQDSLTWNGETLSTSDDTLRINKPMVIGPCDGVESINRLAGYVQVNRLFDGGYGGCGSACNGHSFVDGTEVNRNGTIGYNSFDQKIDVTGTYTYDHISGFQSRPVYSSSGVVSRITGYQHLPTHSGGTATRVTAFEARDPLGAGVITNNYGLYVETLSRGSNNAAIRIGDDDNDQNLIQVGVTGTPTFAWDESEDMFTFNKLIAVRDTDLLSLIVEHGGGGGGGAADLGNFEFDTDTLNKSSNDTAYFKFPVIFGPRDATESINQLATYIGVSRLFDGGSPGCGSVCNGHAFVDGTEVDRDGTIGYNSFDQKIDVTGTYNYDHISGFQSRPVVSTSGTISRITAYQALPTHSGGTCTTVTGLEVRDPLGAGTITNNYGVYIKTLTRGTTDAAVVIGDSDADQTLIMVGVTGAPKFSWDESEDRFTLTKGIDISDIMEVKSDSINANDSIYLKYLTPPTTYGWCVMDSTNKTLFVDSLDDAGFGLVDELLPIDTYLSDVKKIGDYNELKWYYAPGKYVYGIKNLKRPSKTIPALAWQMEHLLRYVDRLEKENKKLKARVGDIEDRFDALEKRIWWSDYDSYPKP